MCVKEAAQKIEKKAEKKKAQPWMHGFERN